MVNPLARVVHVESKTTSDSSLQLHDISEINRARFVKKWGPWLLARQLGAPGTQPASDACGAHCGAPAERPALAG